MSVPLAGVLFSIRHNSALISPCMMQAERLGFTESEPIPGPLFIAFPHSLLPEPCTCDILSSDVKYEHLACQSPLSRLVAMRPIPHDPSCLHQWDAQLQTRCSAKMHHPPALDAPREGSLPA